MRSAPTPVDLSPLHSAVITASDHSWMSSSRANRSQTSFAGASMQTEAL
jgi:hypothetical protein